MRTMAVWLVLLVLYSAAADLEGRKAAACVRLANDWTTLDEEVAKEMRQVKGQTGLALKQVVTDILIYCFNHISEHTAASVLAGELSYKDESVQTLRRYRKGGLGTEDISQKQQENSRRVVDAALRWDRSDSKKADL